MRIWLVLAACASILSGCRQNATAPAVPAADGREAAIDPGCLARATAAHVRERGVRRLPPASVGGVARSAGSGPLRHAAGVRSDLLCRVARDLPGQRKPTEIRRLHLARIFDQQFQPTFRVPLTGPPSRVRISSDGRRAAATVFESGHSYAQAGFSTKTTVIDLSDGRVICDLEEFSRVEGRPADPRQ